MTRRTDKLARLIQAELANLINYRLSDPRVDRMVTITGVELSADLRQAVVRITALDSSDAQMRTVLRGLRHASGALGRMLGERLTTKSCPRLDIRIDEQAIRARRTLDAIQQAMQQVRPEPGDDPAQQESDPE